MKSSYFLAGVKVAYLGAFDPTSNKPVSGGTHSHKAVQLLFGRSDNTGVSYLPCKNFEEIFYSIQNKSAHFGVVPLVNSTSGQVQTVFDFILKRQIDVNCIHILGSMMHHISHDLLGTGNLKDIEVVYSKEEALKQCKEGLRRILGREVKTESVSSTASGVLRALQEGKKAAGLASKDICNFYPNLKILAEDVQDKPINETRFLIVSNRKYKLGGKRERTWYSFISSSKNSLLRDILFNASKWGINIHELHSVIVNPFDATMAYLMEVEGDNNSYKINFFHDDCGVFNIKDIGCGYATIKSWEKAIKGSISAQKSFADSQDVIFSSLPKRVQDNLLMIASKDEFLSLPHSPVSSVESVWATLGIDGKDILKTMILEENNSKEIVFCSVTGPSRVGLPKVNSILNGHYHFARRERLLSTDQIAGGISPLTATSETKILIDEEIFSREKIFLGAGTTETSIVIKPQALLALPTCSNEDIKMD